MWREYKARSQSCHCFILRVSDSDSACFLHLEKWGDTLELLCTVWRLFSHVVTGSVCCAVLMVLFALGPAEWRKEQSCSAPKAMPLPPPQTPHCEKSLGWALWARCIHCLAKCWPDWKAQCPWAWLILSIFSQALSHKQWVQEQKMPNYTQVTKTWGV